MVSINQIDLTKKQLSELLVLLEKFLPNTTVWAYGSRVKGDAEPFSNLDLVAFSCKEQTGTVAELREEFEESDLPFRVDLFVWDEIPESFRQNIEDEHIVVQST